MEITDAKKSKKMHAGHVEVAVAGLINYRAHTIVPNVSWGLGLNHECDMLVLDDKGRFTEIEIKVSLTDLKNDLKKPHGHSSKIISRLVYAFPEKMLEKAISYVPQAAGIIIVKEFETPTGGLARKAEWYRQCKHNKMCQKPTPEQINKFMQLGCMRIWSLKIKNNN